MARPTKYKAEYAEQALKLCRLGATDVELADFFEVSPTTIDSWKRDHKEFLGSIKKGKDFSDAEVADRLFKRATGYSHPEVDIRVIEGEIVQTPLVKHYPPDTPAAIFWLKNRQRGKWRDKVEVDNTSSDGSMSPAAPTMTEEQLDRLARKINDEV
jgi:hypothetical protein